MSGYRDTWESAQADRSVFRWPYHELITPGGSGRYEAKGRRVVDPLGADVHNVPVELAAGRVVVVSVNRAFAVAEALAADLNAGGRAAERAWREIGR